jgi:hypothetical protein
MKTRHPNSGNAMNDGCNSKIFGDKIFGCQSFTHLLNGVVHVKNSQDSLQELFIERRDQNYSVTLTH